MQVGNFATEVSDRSFQGGQASLDVLHVLPELTKLRSNGAQVLKNQIISLVSHHGFFVVSFASGLAQPQSVLDPLQTTFDTVDSLGLAGKVTMQVRHGDIEGSQASPHVSHVRAQLAHLQPKDAQMLEDEGAGLVGP
jgi:hypothetical protein